MHLRRTTSVSSLWRKLQPSAIHSNTQENYRTEWFLRYLVNTKYKLLSEKVIERFQDQRTMTKDSEQEKGVIHCFVIYSQYCLSQQDHHLLFKILLAQSCQRKGTASLSYTTGLVGSSHRGRKPNELWIRVWATFRNFQIKRPKALALVPRPPDTVSV